MFPWLPQSHRGSNAGIQHPGWKGQDDTGFDLDVNHAPTGALLAVVSPDPTTVVWMPAVVDYNFVPDMGRMTA
jgi:hypothetical protein